MTVVIANGQPKSGSTFLYMTAVEIAQHINGEDFYRCFNRLLGTGFTSYVDVVSTDHLFELDEKVGDHLFILKAHGWLQDDVAELIQQGKFKAFTSFRDPRDTALSTLDVGKKDRERGKDRWFAEITGLEQLKDAISFQSTKAFSWVRHPDVLSVPYYITAIDESASVGLIADFLGVPELGSVLAADMRAKREKLPEFNKGVLDRFVAEFSPEDLKYANEIWGEKIAEYDDLLETCMAELGYRMAHGYFTGLRDQAIEKKLAET